MVSVVVDRIGTAMGRVPVSNMPHSWCSSSTEEKNEVWCALGGDFRTWMRNTAFQLGAMGRPALSGLEEFDGDLFTPDVGQLVRTELNRKGSCLR